MKTNQITGILFLAGAIGVCILYTILSVTFNYPGILRQDTGNILLKFHKGGNGLISTWFLFALSGLPLIPAYIMTGQLLEKNSALARSATSIGVTGLIVQMIGLLRWTFVVPMLASGYCNATEAATRESLIISFKTLHQFAGVLLGEHVGQLFTVTWTIAISILLYRSLMVPKWIYRLGIISGMIYFLAQAELLATVIPGLPSWNLAGFAGSTLWLLWLIVLGCWFLLRKNEY